MKDIAKMMVYQSVTKPAAEGISSWIGRLFASANGNALAAEITLGRVLKVC